MIRVFIGTDGDIHQDAEKVVEWSIRKNTKEDVDFTFLRPGWKTPPTGFASHRYLIPKHCNWKGYAIYLDVDMLVLGDLSELMTWKRPNKWAISARDPKKISLKARFRDAVCVIDCSAAKDVLPGEHILQTRSGKITAKNGLIQSGYFAEIIPETWNARVVSPDAKLIHYTNLKTQPWCPDPSIEYEPFPCKKTSDLFFEYLEEAKREL